MNRASTCLFYFNKDENIFYPNPKKHPKRQPHKITLSELRTLITRILLFLYELRTLAKYLFHFSLKSHSDTLRLYCEIKITVLMFPINTYRNSQNNWGKVGFIPNNFYTLVILFSQTLVPIFLLLNAKTKCKPIKHLVPS